jgi:hypothetical protein
VYRGREVVRVTKQLIPRIQFQGIDSKELIPPGFISV